MGSATLKIRGVSLAETIIALFLLAGVVLTLVALLHTLLRYGQRVEMQSLAAVVADKHLEELRLWARRKPGPAYQFENLLTSYANETFTDSEFPEFTLTTQARAHPLDLAGSQLEQPYTDKQRLSQSAVQIRIAVAWRVSGVPQNLIMTSLIGAPARPTQAAVVNLTQISGANPIPALNSAEFQARTVDRDRQFIPDLTYQWYIQPQTGNAAIQASRRDTTQARVTNRVRGLDGSFGPAPGTCLVEARAFYRGRELSGRSASLSLDP